MCEIDNYINGFPQNIQEILLKIRSIIKAKAPKAIEKISYKIPSFHQNGILIYYAAFKNHFSIFPPIKQNDALKLKTAKYANVKGNLRFNYKDEIPWELINEVISQLIYENEARKNAKKT